MVINGEVRRRSGDWAKGEFAVAGKNAGTDFVCVAAPGTSDGFTFNVDHLRFSNSLTKRSKALRRHLKKFWVLISKRFLTY